MPSHRWSSAGPRRSDSLRLYEAKEDTRGAWEVTETTIVCYQRFYQYEMKKQCQLYRSSTVVPFFSCASLNSSPRMQITALSSTRWFQCAYSLCDRLYDDVEVLRNACNPLKRLNVRPMCDVMGTYPVTVMIVAYHVWSYGQMKQIGVEMSRNRQALSECDI
jgi:hypothetical protein